MAKIKSKIKYLLALKPAFGITSVTAQKANLHLLVPQKLLQVQHPDL